MTGGRASPATALLVAACLLAAACAGGTPAATPSSTPFDPFATMDPNAVASPDPTGVAHPRWEHLTTLSGSGPATEALAVDPDAIQWRARWTCQSGHLSVSVPDSDPALVDAACPGEGDAYGIDTGEVRLEVDAAGAWQLEVEQQVETPLREPPLDAMNAPGAQVLARGSFHGIERHGEGSALLYRLDDGRLALRFEDFGTVATDGIAVWVSAVADPATSREVFEHPYVELGPIKATAGEQNYLLPPDLDADQALSVVIWCVPQRIAFAAAPLRR